MNNLDPPPIPVGLLEDIQKNALWTKWLSHLFNFLKGEGWHEVGNTGEPAFQNSWANVGGASDETLGYKKDSFGKLYLKGYIDSGTITDGTVVFTLPTGYRPIKTIRAGGMFVTGSSENSYQIEVQTDGDIAIYGVSGAGPVLSFHKIVEIDNG